MSTPSSASTSAPGSSRSSPTRRARCAGRRRGKRAATTATCTSACSASPTPTSTSSKRKVCCEATLVGADFRTFVRSCPCVRLRFQLEAAAGGVRVKVVVCDVAPRDGLQNDATHLEPAVRAELVNRLAAAGVPRIETVSFVNPQRVPQMAGAEEGVAAIEGDPDVGYARLALNQKGYDRPVATGLDEVHYAFAATETFNERNSNASVEESVQAAEQIIRRAHTDGIRATVTIGASFGCPFEG